MSQDGEADADSVRLPLLAFEEQKKERQKLERVQGQKELARILFVGGLIEATPVETPSMSTDIIDDMIEIDEKTSKKTS